MLEALCARINDRKFLKSCVRARAEQGNINHHAYDRNKDFLRVKEDEANEQHKSMIEALRAAAPEWTFEQTNFVAGRRGAVVEHWCSSGR